MKVIFQNNSNKVFIVFFFTLLIPFFVQAQDADRAEMGISDAVDFVINIPPLFWGWVENFDQIADKEAKLQFTRRINDLRKGLYILEIDKRFLIENIPDDNPDRILISQDIEDLKSTLDDLKLILREVGADLRGIPGLEDEGTKVEEVLSNSLNIRTKGLDEIMAILDSNNYDGEKIREALKNGMNATKEAQLAVTTFYNKIKKD